MTNSAKSVLAVAAKEVGYDRYKDPERGTRYGRWYAKQAKNSYYGQSGVPYCAMFVSWVLDAAHAKCAGFPGAYCPSIHSAAKKAGRLVDKRRAKAGDVVLFDWDGDGVADHVGLVRSNNGVNLSTVEGNTSRQDQSNGGKVANRVRAWKGVLAIVRPDYRKPKAYRVLKARYLYPRPKKQVGRRIAKVPAGVEVDYLGEASGSWRLVRHGGREGWVHNGGTVKAIKTSRWSE